MSYEKGESQSHSAILAPDQQKHVLKIIAFITLIIFVPLGIKNLLIGEIMLGAVLLAFEVSLLAEITCIIYCRPSYLHHFVPLSLLVVSVVLSVHIFGTLASYWIFPVVMTLVFLLPTKQYLISNGLILLASTWAIYPHQDLAVTLRLLVSLVVCITICHYVVNAVQNLHQDLREMSFHDPLTGVLNRSQLDQQLLDACKTDATSSIAILDIDNFKRINDLFGHDVGDQVIKHFAQCVISQLETQDTLFRLGGDEFLVLCPNSSAQQAKGMLEKVATKLNEKVTSLPNEVTFSGGIAQVEPNEPIEYWFKRADIALYKAKANGRNQSLIHSYLNTSGDDTNHQVSRLNRYSDNP